MASVALHIGLVLVLPPLLLGVINRTKAIFAGRRGAPLLQPYYDLWRLLRKSVVYSHTTTWVFRAGPMVSLAAVLAAGMLLPIAGRAAPISFAGDVILFIAFLALGRFFTMAAALDTGSSFEGMGASREAAFGALAEPALFLALAIVLLPAGGGDFGFYHLLPPDYGDSWPLARPDLLLAGGVLFVVLLAENARIPVDDPNTHLELTMIHEVMVLDHSGPDFAFVLYGSAVKLFLFAALLVRVLVPLPETPLFAAALIAGGSLIVAAGVGVVESSMARLRLSRVPQLLVGASVLAGIGLAVLFSRGHP